MANALRDTSQRYRLFSIHIRAFFPAKIAFVHCFGVKFLNHCTRQNVLGSLAGIRRKIYGAQASAAQGSFQNIAREIISFVFLVAMHGEFEEGLWLRCKMIQFETCFTNDGTYKISHSHTIRII
jgi:hypothetical protein